MARSTEPLSLPLNDLVPLLASAANLLQHAVTVHNHAVDSIAASLPPDACAKMSPLAIGPTALLGITLQNLFVNIVAESDRHRQSREDLEHRLQQQQESHQKRQEDLEHRLQQQQEFHEKRFQQQQESHEQLHHQHQLAQEATLEVLRGEIRHRELLLLHHQATWGGSLHETQSEAEVWDRRKLLEHPTTYTATPPTAAPEGLEELKNGLYQREEDTYPQLAAFLTKQLQDCRVGIHLNAVETVIAARKRFLFNRAPDLVLQTCPVRQTPGVANGRLSPELVIVPIEGKFPFGVPLTRSHKGQLLDQLYRLMRLQPWRQIAMGWLTSVEHNCWIEVRRDQNGSNLVTGEISGCNTFEQALSFLVNHVLKDDRQIPSFPVFSPCFTMMEKVLGITRTTFVARFQKPALRDSAAPSTRQSTQSPPNTLTWVADISNLQVLAVKRVHRAGVSLTREIAVLRAIHDAAVTAPCRYLPRLLAYDGLHSLELAIDPVGERVFLPQLLSTPEIAVSVLDNVFEALLWLHRHGWIHRDIRWENIVLAQGRGVLLDLGCAIAIPEQDAEEVNVPYLGGFICCPLRVIQGPDPLPSATYRPNITDDCAAFVLLVVVLLFSQTFQQIPFAQIVDPSSTVRRFLVQLWEALQASSTWGPYANLVTGSDSNYTIAPNQIRNLPKAMLVVPNHSAFPRLSRLASPAVPVPLSPSAFGTADAEEGGYISVLRGVTKQLEGTGLDDASMIKVEH